MMAGAIFSYRMFQRLMIDDKCYFDILDCSEWRWNLVYFDYEILIVNRTFIALMNMSLKCHISLLIVKWFTICKFFTIFLHGTY